MLKISQEDKKVFKEIFANTIILTFIIGFLFTLFVKATAYLNSTSYIKLSYFSSLDYLYFVQYDVAVFIILLASYLLVRKAGFLKRSIFFLVFFETVFMVIALSYFLYSVVDFYWFKEFGSAMLFGIVFDFLNRASDLKTILFGYSSLFSLVLFSFFTLHFLQYAFFYAKRLKTKNLSAGEKIDKRTKVFVAMLIVFSFLPSFTFFLSQKSVLALDPIAVRESKSHFLQFAKDLKDYVLEIEKRSLKSEIAQAQTFSNETLAALSEEAPKIKPNIVLLILESTGYHWTPLHEGEDTAHMPFFEKLAGESLEVVNTRTTMPHSAKSFVSIFSGGYPTMTSFLTLTQKDFEIATIASYLSKYGYKSAFFQPAKASFERRPPLIKNFGFDHFLTAEEVNPQSPVLGAFNRDDFILLDPIVDWVKSQESPYFLTMFTSVTHHPYVVPGGENMTSTEFLGLDAKTKKENYFEALNYSDNFIKSLIGNIKSLGEDTLFVIVGDHGEGFGEHGLFSHSQNLYEESLRVPLIFHWPGKIKPERKEGLYSVMDISPTILSYLGVQNFNDGIYGIDINSQLPERDLFFSAWQDNTSVGFIDSSGKKIIHDPTNNIWEIYNINTDPREKNNLYNEEEFSEEKISEMIEKLVSWKEKTLSGIRKVEEREYFEVYNWICTSDVYGSCTIKNKNTYSDL